MTIEELNKLIRDSITTITGVQAIEHHPNAPRPSGQFATVHILNTLKVGGLSKKIEDNVNALDVDETIVMLRVSQISINFYRSTAMQDASIFSELLSRSDIVESFNAVSAGVIRASDVRDLTEAFGPDLEERSQLDLFVQFELSPIVVLILGVAAYKVAGQIENHGGIIDNVTIP